jgi:hypothetical protein
LCVAVGLPISEFGWKLKGKCEGKGKGKCKVKIVPGLK